MILNIGRRDKLSKQLKQDTYDQLREELDRQEENCPAGFLKKILDILIRISVIAIGVIFT